MYRSTFLKTSWSVLKSVRLMPSSIIDKITYFGIRFFSSEESILFAYIVMIKLVSVLLQRK